MPPAAQRLDVVHLDESFAERSIDDPKIASAYETSIAVDRQTRRPQHRVTLMNGEQPENFSPLQLRLIARRSVVLAARWSIPTQRNERLAYLRAKLPIKLSVHFGTPARRDNMIPAAPPIARAPVPN